MIQLKHTSLPYRLSISAGLVSLSVDCLGEYNTILEADAKRLTDVLRVHSLYLRDFRRIEA